MALLKTLRQLKTDLRNSCNEDHLTDFALLYTKK